MLDEKDEEEKRVQRRLLNRDVVLSQRERESRETEREKRQREVEKITKKTKSKGVSSDKRRDRLKELGMDMDEEVELTEKALLDIANEVAQVTVRVDADLQYISSHVKESFRSRIGKSVDKIKDKAVHHMRF